MSFNILDIITITVLLLFILIGAKKGFIISFFNFFSSIMALFLSNAFYPILTGVLRKSTGLYEYLKVSVSDAIGLNDFIHSAGKAAESQAINSLSLPDFIKQPLLENNNPEIYNLLDSSGLADYIAGFIANLLLSAISMVIIFILFLIGLKFLATFLNILAKLPIINVFNKTGGAFIGFFQGFLVLSLIITFSTVFLTQPKYAEMYVSMQSSVIAKYFYEHNFILNTLLLFIQ